MPHAICPVPATGEIDDAIVLPQALQSSQTCFGSEGVTKIGNTLWAAIQHEWADDPKRMVKLLACNLDDKSWKTVHSPL